MVCLAQVHKVHLNPNTLDFTPKLHGLSGRRVRIIQVLAKNIDPDLTWWRKDSSTAKASTEYPISKQHLALALQSVVLPIRKMTDM
jgi:hypothetical protein